MQVPHLTGIELNQLLFVVVHGHSKLPVGGDGVEGAKITIGNSKTGCKDLSCAETL
jgi:hypothetical protein